MVQVHQDIAGVALASVKVEEDIETLAIPTAQKGDQPPVGQQVWRPEVFTATASIGAMDQSD
jgi:hypothetical protein